MSAFVFGLLRTRALLRTRDEHRGCERFFLRDSLAHFSQGDFDVCVCKLFRACSKNGALIPGAAT